jgi:5S rRNA maturation endonuclease (ribonuclease M5)
MDREAVKELMSMLRLEDITDRDEWVSSTCPFGSWRHENGVSTRNSFGIKIGPNSIYHCFSCGAGGALTQLPTNLYMNSGGDRKEIREFINSKEVLHTYTSPFEKEELPPPKILDYRSMFAELPKGSTYRGLEWDTIWQWGLKFDIKENRLIIPTRDGAGNVIAMKGRATGPTSLKYRLYTELMQGNKDPKAYGFWFGMEKPLISKKGVTLVEGELDTMIVWQSGLISNIWGCTGAGISQKQIDTLSSLSVPLIFFLDDDMAGEKVKWKIRRRLNKSHELYEVKNYYGCKDPGELYEKGLLKHAIYSIDRLDKKK